MRAPSTAMQRWCSWRSRCWPWPSGRWPVAEDTKYNLAHHGVSQAAEPRVLPRARGRDAARRTASRPRARGRTRGSAAWDTPWWARLYFVSSATGHLPDGQGQHRERQEHHRCIAVLGARIFDEVREPADQERHTGHHRIAECRAEGDHQEIDARARRQPAGAGMLDRKEEIEQHRDHADAQYDRVDAALRGGQVESHGQAVGAPGHQRIHRVLDLLQDVRGDYPWNRHARPEPDHEGKGEAVEPGGLGGWPRPDELAAVRRDERYASARVPRGVG